VRRIRGSKTPLIALLVVEGLILFFALEHHFSHLRWDVKTLTDPSRSRVRRTPIVDTTVAALSRIPPPAVRPAPGERIAPFETTVYRVHARLLVVHQQLDLDDHLEIADLADPSKTMIVEIPAPSEARGSGLEGAFARARTEVSQRTRGPRPKGGWDVVVTGVGFFDFTHFQPGASASGFELHPVFGIEFPPAAGGRS
jgi:hypothetical protein